MKIQNKLTVQFLLIVASILGLFSIAVYQQNEDYRQDEFFSRLKERALTTSNFLFEVDEVDFALLKKIEAKSIYQLKEEQILIFDDNRKMLYFSGTDSIFRGNYAIFDKVKKERFIKHIVERKEAIALYQRTKEGDFYVFATAFDKYGKRKIQNLGYVLIIGYLVSLLLTLIGGLFFSGQALRPISKINEEVNEIGFNNLTARLSTGNGRDEIAQLAMNFNTMLDRLSQAIDMQKSFISNASHEMRTPLSAMKSQLDVMLLSDRKQEEYRDTMRSVLEDIEGLTLLSNRLLSLAQSEMDISRMRLDEVRIDELIYQIQQELIKQENTTSFTFDFKSIPEDDGNLIVIGNANLLKSLIFNLIENAIKYSNGSAIKVILDFDNTFLLLEVIDSGIGIAPEELDKIFTPFYRSDNARFAKGHGIGLSLCAKITTLHRGFLHIDSIINEGTTVILKLPHLLGQKAQKKEI